MDNKGFKTPLKQFFGNLNHNILIQVWPIKLLKSLFPYIEQCIISKRVQYTYSNYHVRSTNLLVCM